MINRSAFEWDGKTYRKGIGEKAVSSHFCGWAVMIWFSCDWITSCPFYWEKWLTVNFWKIIPINTNGIQIWYQFDSLHNSTIKILWLAILVLFIAGMRMVTAVLKAAEHPWNWPHQKLWRFLVIANYDIDWSPATVDHQWDDGGWGCGTRRKSWGVQLRKLNQLNKKRQLDLNLAFLLNHNLNSWISQLNTFLIEKSLVGFKKEDNSFPNR